MNPHDETELTSRLAALEGRVPVSASPPALRPRARRRRFAFSMAMAPALVLALVATVAAGVAGAVVVSNMVRGYEGIENPGQPLAGANMECMSPPVAARFLADHGFTVVIWQVEAGDPNSKTNDGLIATTSVQQKTPPAHGYVVPGGLQDDGSVIMVVDQRVGATGTGDCLGDPMP
ncbi:MAG: hypothetical protein ABI553_10715 [Chloroflexota bacterium]